MLNMFVFTTTNQPQLFMPGALGVFIGFVLLLSLLAWIGLWKMFSKAGIPGILGIIPLVNIFFLPQVGGKPGWWGLLLLIPLVNIVFIILIYIGIAERFGRGTGTVLGLIFLTGIFVMILGLGSAQWTPAPERV